MAAAPPFRRSIRIGHVDLAADALSITAPRLLELGLIDKVVREPLGGAHRNPHSMAVRLKAVLLGQLNSLEQLDTATLLEQRYQRLRSYGAFKVS